MTATGRRIARRLGIALVVVLAALLAGLYWLLSGSLAHLDGTRATRSLAGAVSIERDALGTVTITGRNRDDISFALGYVHAQERFFAMDLMRRMPAGELAALVGPAALQTDIDHRRHLLRAVARQAVTQLPADQRRALQRYTDGVNAGLSDLRVRPWEYLLLRSTPRPWRAEDSVLMVAAMYLNLNGNGNNIRELRLAQMHATLPGPIVDLLLAPDAHWEAPLRGALSPLPVIPVPQVMDLRADPSMSRIAGLAAALLPATNRQYPGSNSFAVGGALTATGAAMLANDMHLNLGVPNIWFRTRLRYPDASAPNGQVAWGFTNSYGDWLDWVRVIRDSADPSRYKVPGGWATLTHAVEKVQVKGQADTTLEVALTRFGPILGTDVDGTPLALAWTAGAPRAYNLDLMRMERIGSVRDALMLAPQLGMPAQNLLVADRAGHVGWTIAGNSIPLRGTADPLLPADWSIPGSGWQGWTAAAAYPRIEDPANSRLWTANNRIVDGANLTRLGNGGHDLGARALQIRDDLLARGRFTPGALLDIQLDDHALFLTRWQRLLQETLAGNDEPALKPLRDLTAAWGGRAATTSVDYRLVRAFRTEVTNAVLAPFVARVKRKHADFAWPGESSAEAAVWALLRAQPSHLLDPHYASWHELLLDAAGKVTAALGAQPGGLAARSWGERNRSAIRHPLAVALPGWLAHFINMPDQPLPGDHDMPRVAAPGFGASERMAVAPGEEAHGTLSMPGGQSDHPLSPFFGAGHEDWVNGRATPLLPGASEHELRLTPTAN